MLTIRDLQSQEQFAVPPEGAVLGREGGGADIVVRDKSVSKRHAKVYERGGKWFLEDLQSANGTYVDEQPVTRPVNMRPGMSFSLSNYHFEVLAPEAGSSARPRKAAPMAEEWDADGGYPDETAPPLEDEWAPEVSERGNRTGPGGKKPPGGKPNGSSKSAASAGKKSSSSQYSSRGAGRGDASGGVVAQIPKAIGHYLKAVPLLLVNPVGFIRGSIDDMKYPAMKPIELLPWGLVAALFNVGMGIGAGFISTIVSMIQTKAFSVGAIIGLFVGSAIGLVIAVVVAVVSAFIFHPVMGFIIRILKGESDETNRSNYYVCVMTAYVLMGLPAAAVGISAVFGLIPVIGKFGAVLPLLGGIIGQFYLLLVAFFWLKYFQVMKWVPIVVIVLAVLGAASSMLGVVNVIRAGGGGVAGAGTAALTAEQQAAIAAAQAAANGGVVPDGGAGSTDADPDATGKAGDGASGSTPDSAGTEVAMATPSSVRPTPKPSGGNNPGVAVAPIAGGLTGYQRWAAKRDAVEKAVADDPTILRTDREFLADYKQYHKLAHGVRLKYAKVRRDPALEPVAVRMIDAETYEQTGPLMDKLYARISR